VGLEVDYFEGYVRHQETQGYHAWNAVKIGNEWRMVDAAWGSVPSEREQWFLVSQDEFLKSHVPDSNFLDSNCYRCRGLTPSKLNKLRAALWDKKGRP
jgi:transglutaminase/protease-like cytokinesis protein 3